MTGRSPAGAQADPAPATPSIDAAGGSGRSSGRSSGRGASIVRGLGEVVLTLGVVLLLFVVHQVWITTLFSDREQARIAGQLHDRWSRERTPATPGTEPAGGPAVIPPLARPVRGEAFAVLHIPRLAPEYERAVVEGTGDAQLAGGPGHYPGTALPGEEGNFAVAGHRVGRGAPFLDLDRLLPGDPIVVETAHAWYVYRVLGDRSTGDFAADPSGIPGRAIVSPDEVDVIAPIPGGGPGAPPGAYLTLTTCHPKYAASERLIIHAALEGAPIPWDAAPAGPAALRES